MKIALVLTVKNESRLLRYNLLYHQAVGITKAFVYFDGTTDDGKKTIQDLNFVAIQDSVSADKYIGLDFLHKFTSQAEEHHTARQCLNTYDAVQKCKDFGYDWLISIDADELIATESDVPSDLKSFFSDVDETIEMINFKTMEVLQQKENFGNVFSEADLFKTRKNFKYRGESIYREIYNPKLKINEKHHFWYGQTMGKAAIKVNSNLIPINVHRYQHIDGSKPKLINDGFVLHYHAYDAKDFIKKFKNFSNHPNHFLSGSRVEPLKLLLKDVVNNYGYSDEELKDYFNKYLLFDPKRVKQLLRNRKLKVLKRKQNSLKRISSAVLVFKKLNLESPHEKNQ
ncbi:MAG: glycosyltransferase family 2 protein [Gelidibacter sp.]